MNPFDPPIAPPPLAEPPAEAAAEMETSPRRKRSWLSQVSGLAWIILCFELGAFLLVYPWMDGWDRNVLALWLPGLQPYWANTWLRGAISGLGTVNIVIALTELFRYLKHWLFE